MSNPLTAAQNLDREFLELRARILELAAAFDRLDRAEGSVDDDPRVRRLLDGIEILSQSRDDRAEQVQLLFSREYAANWRERFGLAPVG